TSASVPSALPSYRRIATEYPESPAAQTALTKLSQMYEDLGRFELAAETLTILAARFPDPAGEAWFRAAEIYRRHLNTAPGARAAYQRVPPTSHRYAGAQRLLRQNY